MCLSVPEHRRGKAVPGTWLNESGRVAHPHSPAGLGGPGAFRSPGVFGKDASDDLLPEADAPVARGVDPSLIALADEATEAKAKRQPAPKVTEDAKPEVVQTVLTIKLLKDRSNVQGIQGAFTDFQHKASGQLFKHVDTEGKVDRFTNTLAWIITVNTDYGTGIPDEDAAYGRGRMKKDEEVGNVTLGFHESCHRELLLDYFRNRTFPSFDGAVGDTGEAFDEKAKTYRSAIQAYFDKARTENEAAVDEIGEYPKSKYLEALAAKQP